MLRETRYFWAECPCEAERDVARLAKRDAAVRAKQQSDAVATLGDDGLGRVAGMTFDAFDPAWLTSDAASHPLHIARNWLTTVLARASADYRDPACPPACRYFYSPGKGRGKTHLAAAIALACRQVRGPVAWLEEETYLTRLWSCTLEERASVLALPGDKARLTVIDDCGQRQRGSAAVQDAYYAVLNRRWLARGWTIITSNWTPDELADRQIISEATYSRLTQMTRGEVVFFDGGDYRRREM